MLIKEKVIDIINGLPEKFSIDELVEQLILLEKIDIGLKQVEEGKTLTMEQAKEKLKNGIPH